MNKSGKIKSVATVVLSVLLWTSVVEANGIENNPLDTIIVGIAYNDGLITNISFDYVVDYNVSGEWRIKQLEFTKSYMGSNWMEGMELRIPTLEHTLRTGSAIFEENKFKIASKWVALFDQKLFQDEIVTCDGIKLTELDLKENAGNISDEVDRRKAHLTFDPRNFPVLFADGQPLNSALTDQDITTKLVGTEKIDGTMCHIIEMIKNFMTPEGIQKQSSRKCWIAPNKGFRIKKAISYGTNSFEGKPLTITQCKLAEITKGIWYYSKVTFESYPLSLPRPDVIETLELKNIVVNQQLNENAFTTTFPVGCFINDEVTNRKYRVGEDPNASEKNK